MEWTDSGIVLSARKHGESAAIVALFTEGHGRHLGLVRGGTSARLRGSLQAGNEVRVRWSARLEEHLGGYVPELMVARAAALLDDARRLAALTAACALIEAALPERHPYPELYAAFHRLLEALDGAPGWAEAYIRFELAILAELGFGLDLKSCAASGVTRELRYVSPRSGRAVSAAAGEPYRDRLLHLPGFLTETAAPAASPAELADGLRLTGHFLSHHLFAATGGKLPPARTRLADRLAG